MEKFLFPLFRRMAQRTVTTLPGRQARPDLKPLYVGFSEMPLVTISNAQRKPIPNANFVPTVYHGIPAQLLKPHYRPRANYLASHHHLSPQKRPPPAIQSPRHTQLPIHIT